MKTSNKILLGLLITIFTVPLLLAAALNSKVKNGKYTVVKNEYDSVEPTTRSGILQDFKVVQFVGPEPQNLICHIKQSDTSSFNYRKYNDNDSVAVFVQNDTLFVTYIQPKNETGKTGDGNGIVVDLRLPGLNTVVIDGAIVVLDSLQTPNGVSVTLKNGGQIKNGDKRDDEARAIPVVPARISLRVEETAQLDMNTQVIDAVENLKAPVDMEVKDMLIFRLM